WQRLELLVLSPNGAEPDEWARANADERQDSGDPARGATPSLRWAAAFQDALNRFHAYALACPADAFDTGQPLPRLFNAPLPKEALDLYASRNRVSSAQLQAVLAPAGSIPAARPLQFSLSQVVSGGYPGFAASVAGSPALRSRTTFARHLVLA